MSLNTYCRSVVVTWSAVFSSVGSLLMVLTQIRGSHSSLGYFSLFSNSFCLSVIFKFRVSRSFWPVMGILNIKMVYSVVLIAVWYIRHTEIILFRHHVQQVYQSFGCIFFTSVSADMNRSKSSNISSNPVCGCWFHFPFLFMVLSKLDICLFPDKCVFTITFALGRTPPPPKRWWTCVLKLVSSIGPVLWTVGQKKVLAILHEAVS